MKQSLILLLAIKISKISWKWEYWFLLIILGGISNELSKLIVEMVQNLEVNTQKLNAINLISKSPQKSKLRKQ